MSYGDKILSQHRLRYWLLVSRHQAIHLTNVDLSHEGHFGIQLRAVSHEMLKNTLIGMHL